MVTTAACPSRDRHLRQRQTLYDLRRRPQQPSGIAGISFDFNYGARVTVPQGEYRVRFIDRKACLTVYDAPASGVLVASSKKYFIDFRIEVYEKDKMIFAHDLDLRSQKVLLKFPVGILGDILAWFPMRKPSAKARLPALLRHGRRTGRAV